MRKFVTKLKSRWLSHESGVMPRPVGGDSPIQAISLLIVGAVLEIVVWRDWVSFEFDVVAILGITHFLFRILRRSPGDSKEKDRAKS